jgi:hypothetical protein
LGVAAIVLALLALPPAAFAAAPGPPNVEVVPPDVILTDRGDEPVTFAPRLILFTFGDGTETSCVIDPAAPPDPCTELAGTPGPPDVEVVPPELVVDRDGEPVGFIAGLILIAFADGTELS